MTNEKAIMCLEDMKIKVTIPKAAKQARENNEALDVAIKALQSAEPKRGKWNRLDMDTFNCNRCGATFVLNQGGEKMHFCPNCGADMRGEQE